MAWMHPLPRRHRKQRALSAKLGLECLERRLVLSGDPSLSLTLAAHSVSENAGPAAVLGTITRNNMDTSQPLTVNLTSSNTTHATVPASVTIPAGAASAPFSVAAVDDGIVEPTQTVTITGYAASPLPAGLDATYGSGGYATVPLQATWSANFPDVKVPPDGKIVGVAAPSTTTPTWAVTRTLSTGVADTSFGGTGTVVTSFPGATGGYANSVAFQPDGKIVVAGVVMGTNPYDTWGVARYNANGSLDTTFGSGGLYPFAFNASTGYGGWAYDVAVQPDGKILVGGMLRGTGMGFSVGRLSSSGQLDTTFGSNGIASLNVNPNSIGQAMILQPDGKIVMTGSANGQYLPIARFTATGAADTSFNGTGVRLIPYSAFGTAYASIVGYGLTMQSDGKIVAVGQAANSSYSNADYITARVNPDGSLDTSFSGDGVDAIDFAGGNDTAYDVAVQTDGKILVGGQTVIVGQGFFLSLARYNANGTLDTSFNGTGKLTTMPAHPFEALWGIDLQTDGKLVGIAEGAGSNGSFTQFVRFDTGLLTASDYLNVTDADGVAPAAAADAYTTSENSPLTITAPGVLANDTPANSTPLVAVQVSAPSHGTVTLNADGSFVYTPAPNFASSDTFTYKDTENQLTSNTATVTITVNAVDQPPVAVNDSYTTNENSTLTVSAPGVLANDTDPENNTLTALVVQRPSHGSLTLNANGSFTYMPAANFAGADSFTYAANDGQLNSNVATVALTVNAVNQPPVAQSGSYGTTENAPVAVQLTGSDAETPTAQLVFTVTQLPGHGSLADGSGHPVGAGASFTGPVTLTYTPATNYYGSDSFTYIANDGQLNSNPATIALTINHVDQPPVAVNDSYSTNEDTPLVVSGPGTTSLAMVSQPGDYIGQGRTYNFSTATGTFSANHTANDNDLLFSYQDANPYEWWYLEFMAPQGAPLLTGTYTNAGRAGFEPATQPGLDVSGDGRGSNTLTGSFTVTQAVYGAAGNIVSFDATFVQHSEGMTPALTGEIKYNATPAMTGVLLNDSDVDSPNLTAILVSGPAHGSVQLNANGSFTYTPAANFNGTDSFTYKANDGGLDSNVATVAIVVNPVNDAPSFIKGADQSIPEGAGAQVVPAWATAISAGPPDEANQTLNFVVNSNNSALFAVAPAIDPTTGTLSYTPAVGAIGSATVTVYLHDNGGTANGGVDTSAAQTFTIQVNNVPPVVSLGGNVTLNEGDTLQAAGSFADPGSETWTATVDYGDGGGPQPLTLNLDKSFSLSHLYADNGSYVVVVTVTDSNNGVGSNNITITVNNVAPTATLSNNGPINEGSSATVSFSGQFDPSSVDTAAGFHYSFALSTGALATSYAAAATASSASFAFADDGSYTVYGRIFDKDGGSTDYATIITVNNVAPTATLSNNGPINEGSSATVSFSGQFDPSSVDTAAGFHYSFALSSAALASTYAAAGSASSAAFSFADNGSYTVYGRIFDKDGGSTDYATTITVNNVAPTATLSNNGPISEGSSATVSFSGQFDPSSVDTAAGFHYSFALSTAALATSYAAAGSANSASFPFADNGSYTVYGRIFDKDGGSTDYSTVVQVNNVPPTSDALSGPTTGVRGQARTFTLTARDPSPVDQAANFTFAINWGDGTTQTVTGLSGLSVDHTYLNSGTYHVQLTSVTDKDGGRNSQVIAQTLTIKAVDMQGTTLAIGGTTADDHIIVTPVDTVGDLNVSINGVSQGTFNPTGEIVAYGQAGNDTIQIASAKIHGVTVYVAVPAALFGGDGNDTLDVQGSSANNILVGGAGNDNLLGGSGRDLLIGGQGSDTLKGNGGDDILIGDATDNDSNLVALNAIMAEWGRTDATYYTARVNHLNGSVAGGLNGAYLLTPATVHDDAAVDQLYGGADMDWFFYTAAGSNKDKINDQTSGEITTAI